MSSTYPLLEVVREIGPSLASRASAHDSDDSFVAENFDLLRKHKLMSALVPGDLGGGGCSHGEMCEALRELAHYCSSTALALSMHQHLVAFQRYNHQHGKPGRAVLERVAAEQLVLISTGARDYLSSSGAMEKVDGGFVVHGKKSFASASPVGDLLVTSAPYEDPEAGWQVLHFAVPFTAEGVRIESDWKAMGMRGTGSHSVILEGAFVPDKAVALRRPRGRFHPVWPVIFTVAMPLISAVYVGIAEAAAEKVVARGKGREQDRVFHAQLGEVLNHVATCRVALDSMIALCNNFDFSGSNQLASDILTRKSIAVRAGIDASQKALAAVGGGGYYRFMGLERLVRDSLAGQFHPLPEHKQWQFSGLVALGLEPSE